MYMQLNTRKVATSLLFVDITQQLVTTSGYQDAFAWLAKAC